ncbi:MAG: siphovirus Gp157 family protein [Clostridia bacterium]|nr:siphovirus Gp157 family protein [Clostridia bacterium]
MSRLYELKENYKQIAEMLYEEEIDEQMILDTLESIESEIEDKADNYAVIIKELLADAEICKQEKARLEARQKSFEGRAKFLKDKLEETMRETGKTKFKTAKFSFGIQKNGGLAPLWIDEDYSNIPQKYLKVEPDNTKIRQALDGGENIFFAHYEERGESLRIR